MKLRFVAAMSALMLSAIAMPAFAGPDLYVVNFHDNKDMRSQQWSPTLRSGLSQAQINAEEVMIDTTTAAKWEKGAHEAMDRQIVPVFNRWVGLPGFAVVIDARSKQVMGCMSSEFNADEIAAELRKMAASARGEAYITRASIPLKSTACPQAYNKIP